MHQDVASSAAQRLSGRSQIPDEHMHVHIDAYVCSALRGGFFNFSIFPVRDLERNRITAREWLFRYCDVDGAATLEEKERETNAARLIYISRELSAFDISGGQPSHRVLSAGGLASPRWALNIHQFPADICVTRALQPARRVSAIGNTKRAFCPLKDFFLLFTIPLLFVLSRFPLHRAIKRPMDKTDVFQRKCNCDAFQTHAHKNEEF